MNARLARWVLPTSLLLLVLSDVPASRGQGHGHGHVIPGPVVIRPSFDPFQDALGRLRSHHDNSRRDGAITLGRIGDPRAVPDLIWILRQDRDGEVRTAAAFALGAIGDPNAAGALRQAAASDRNKKVRQAATHAFGKIAYGGIAVAAPVGCGVPVSGPVEEPIAAPNVFVGPPRYGPTWRQDEEYVPPPPPPPPPPSPFAPGPRLEPPRGGC